MDPNILPVETVLKSVQIYFSRTEVESNTSYNSDAHPSKHTIKCYWMRLKFDTVKENSGLQEVLSKNVMKRDVPNAH